MLDLTGLLEDDLAIIATRRPQSFLSDDMEDRRMHLRDAVEGSRVIVIGGAGSIGASTVEQVLSFRPAALHVVDANENALAELVRSLRSRSDLRITCDLRLWPLDYGGPAMERLLGSEASYDLVLNFAALKHVRSEKDVPSLLQMLETNVLKLDRLLSWLDRDGHSGRRFSVSTDKAANPGSLMGASKRLMELVLLSRSTNGIGATSARFANVAFSNGSLLQSFLLRLARRQPLAVPRDVRRYFMSLREAGEICLLAACATPRDHVLIPRLNAESDQVLLTDIAVAVLGRAGLEAAPYVDEAEARGAVEDEFARGRYPLLLTAPDTSGEKLVEEFVGEDEELLELGFTAVQGIRFAGAPAALGDVVAWLEQLVNTPSRQTTKTEIVARLAAVVGGLRHIEAGKSLDDRL